MLVILIAIAILSLAFVPNFATPLNLSNLTLQSIDLAIIAVGMTFVMLNGGVDFSVTSVLALSSVLGAWTMALSPLAGTPLAIPAGILVMIGVGIMTGAVNGFSVVVLKMPSFIATLATKMILSGIAIWFTSHVAQRASIYGLPDEFFVLGGSNGLIWVPFLITIVVIGFAHWLLTQTMFGRQAYAVGTNPKAAFISGLPVKKTVFTLMLLSGLFAGIQGVIATARNQVGLPSLGDRIFIDIAAAIILGGTSIFGGSGGIKQTVYGVLFITLLNNVVTLLGAEWYVISLIKGVLILVAAGTDFLTKYLSARGRHQAST